MSEPLSEDPSPPYEASVQEPSLATVSLDVQELEPYPDDIDVLSEDSFSSSEYTQYQPLYQKYTPGVVNSTLLLSIVRTLIGEEMEQPVPRQLAGRASQTWLTSADLLLATEAELEKAHKRKDDAVAGRLGVHIHPLCAILGQLRTDAVWDMLAATVSSIRQTAEGDLKSQKQGGREEFRDRVLRAHDKYTSIEESQLELDYDCWESIELAEVMMNLPEYQQPRLNWNVFVEDLVRNPHNASLRSWAIWNIQHSEHSSIRSSPDVTACPTPVPDVPASPPSEGPADTDDATSADAEDQASKEEKAERIELSRESQELQARLDEMIGQAKLKIARGKRRGGSLIESDPRTDWPRSDRNNLATLTASREVLDISLATDDRAVVDGIEGYLTQNDLHTAVWEEEYLNRLDVFAHNGLELLLDHVTARKEASAGSRTAAQPVASSVGRPREDEPDTAVAA